MKLRDALILVTAAFCLSGCAKPFQPCSVATDNDKSALRLFYAPDTRARHADRYFGEEYATVSKHLSLLQARAYGNISGAQRPRVAIGLALSGGGLRSNAFQLGLLNGLNGARGSEFSNQGNGTVTALDNIAYISSVSGGTWAAAAFMSYRKPTAAGSADVALKTDTSAFFNELNETVLKNRALARCAPGYVTSRDDCADNATRILNNSYEYTLQAMDRVPSILNIGSPNAGYTAREAWRELLLGTNLLGVDRQMTDMLQKEKPFWIINTTHSAESSGNNTHHFPFQITPAGVATIADCGNTNYCGFHKQYSGFDRKYTPRGASGIFPPFSVSQAMAMSGAVFPERILGFKLNLFEWDVPLPRPNDDDLFKGAAQCLKDSDASFKDSPPVRDRYTLADGGHSENFGALALMERGVDLLILSDAGHDPGFTFDSYMDLKHHADRLLGMDFFVAAESAYVTDFWKRPYAPSRTRSVEADLPKATQLELATRYATASVMDNSTMNTPLHAGKYGFFDGSGGTGNVLYLRPPRNIHRPPYDLSEFMRYLLDKDTEAVTTQDAARGKMAREALRKAAVAIAEAQNRSCVAELRARVDRNPAAVAFAAAVNGTSADGGGKALAKLQSDLGAATPPALLDNKLEFERLRESDIARAVSNSTLSGVPLLAAYEACDADRGAAIKASVAERDAILGQIYRAISEVQRSGKGISGYLATFHYLLLNKTNFPHDETFVLSYDRDLIFAYYLLGTYIGEKKLAPALREYLKAEADAAPSH
jgi:hypothetical protein